MKILLYVLLAFGVFCFFSCKRTEKEQLTFLMKEWTRKEILFHDRAVFTIQGKDTLDKFPYASTYYKIVTYVDSLGCLSCKLQLLERINFIAEVDSVTSRNVSFYFFFHPRNRKELIMTLQSEDFIYPVCIDLKDTFNKLCILWLCTCSDMVAVTNHDLFFVQDSYCIHASYSDKR